MQKKGRIEKGLTRYKINKKNDNDIEKQIKKKKNYKDK